MLCKYYLPPPWASAFYHEERCDCTAHPSGMTLLSASVWVCIVGWACPRESLLPSFALLLPSPLSSMFSKTTLLQFSFSVDTHDYVWLAKPWDHRTESTYSFSWDGLIHLIWLSPEGKKKKMQLCSSSLLKKIAHDSSSYEPLSLEN